MKTHTLRGRLQEGTIKRLVVDDGRLTHGMRITKFVVATDNNVTTSDAMGVLGLQGRFPTFWDWSDNNQIAWASTGASGLSSVNSPFILVDRNHIIIRDLFLTVQVGGTGGSDFVNYYIEMEAVDLSINESILQLVKERNQGELQS